MSNEEYGFSINDMESNFTLTCEYMDTVNNKRLIVDLVVFKKDKEHTQYQIIRISIIQSFKIKIYLFKNGIKYYICTALEKQNN